MRERLQAELNPALTDIVALIHRTHKTSSDREASETARLWSSVVPALKGFENVHLSFKELIRRTPALPQLASGVSGDARPGT